jgi:Ca-activated chloride channel family protein
MKRKLVFGIVIAVCLTGAYLAYSHIGRWVGSYWDKSAPQVARSHEMARNQTAPRDSIDTDITDWDGPSTAPLPTDPDTGGPDIQRQAMPGLAQDTPALARARIDALGVRHPGAPKGVPAIDEELWIIERPETPAPPGDDSLGSGALIAILTDAEKEVPVPLKHTDVQAIISGYIATVDVTQQFHNPYDVKIEAKYVFPLPQNAAINEFIMTIGERRIRGIIRERQEAERIYLEARRQGYVASLLTQERPNIFTQKVANIEPDKQIDVNIKYFQTLAYADGWYEFVFPMVVGPRFNPPGHTNGVGAVGHGAGGTSGQKTEVTYLRPNERSGHDISVTVKITAGVPVEDIECPSHVIARTAGTDDAGGSGSTTVKLGELDSIPNKDFVLRYKVAGAKMKSALLTQRNEDGGYFTLMLFPPDTMKRLARKPMEMIFVLDCSGSMSGKPIAKAKTAIEHALRRLQPADTFQIIRFSNNASQLGPEPLPATRGNVSKGLRYVSELSGGGTMMIEGIKAALDFEHDPRRLRVVSFMTDGFIGNDTEIIGEVHKRLGASRIFSFGVGSSVNRYLLQRMAKLGRGAVAYVGLDESGGKAVDLFYERISHPAMTDISIDWGGMEVADVFPSRTPDLFVGRPLILTGRFKGDGETTVGVTGKVGDETRRIALHLNANGAAHRGIPAVWARMKIADLADRSTYDQDADLPEQIKLVALEHGLMSAYTAFVAVDSLTRTSGDHGVSVAVPVPVPDGVRYETTVNE